MAMNEGRRWTIDDAWWLDPPPALNHDQDLPSMSDGDIDGSDMETLWADDAEAWEEEPHTSPDITGAPPRGGAGLVAEAAERREEIDPLWAYF
jgi:hypothetical protein